MLRAAVLLTVISAPLFAGALYIEVGNPDANPEAKAMKALVVARVTACHEPARSVVHARLVRMEGGSLLRSELKLVPLKEPGAFGVLGDVPAGSVIDIAVTNPEYKNYEPRVLMRAGTNGMEWASVKHFFSTPPRDSDIVAELTRTDLALPVAAAKR